jgi:hypothetical protein
MTDEQAPPRGDWRTLARQSVVPTTAEPEAML